MIATTAETNEVRQRFYNAAKSMYPRAGEPGTVWVLTQVLGWDMDRVTAVCVDGFGRNGYRVFVMSEADEDGKKYRIRVNGEPLVITRKWTSEEKRKLKDWWWLLGF